MKPYYHCLVERMIVNNTEKYNSSNFLNNY